MSEPSSTPLAYKDRSTGLVVFGVLQLVLGSCSGLLVPLMVGSALLSRSLPAGAGRPLQGGVVVLTVALYGMLAIFFVSLGIGSLRARRWAHTLTLVSSWIWLVSGLLGQVFWLTTLPALRQQLVRAQPPPPPAVVAVGLVVMTFVTFGLYVLLPLAFVLFYRSAHVRATCEARDPRVPWTDRCPAPVLAACLLSALAGLSLAVTACTYQTLAFFVLLTGLPAALGGLALAGLYGWSAMELYRLRLRGWQVALGTGSLLTLSGASLWFTLDIHALYAAMGYPPAMVEQMGSVGASLRWAFVVWPLVWLVFLAWVRRFLPAEA